MYTSHAEHKNSFRAFHEIWSCDLAVGNSMSDLKIPDEFLLWDTVAAVWEAKDEFSGELTVKYLCEASYLFVLYYITALCHLKYLINLGCTLEIVKFCVSV